MTRRYLFNLLTCEVLRSDDDELSRQRIASGEYAEITKEKYDIQTQLNAAREAKETANRVLPDDKIVVECGNIATSCAAAIPQAEKFDEKKAEAELRRVEEMIERAERRKQNNTSTSTTTSTNNTNNTNNTGCRFDTSIFQEPDTVYANLNQGIFEDSWYFGKLIDGRPVVITSKKTFFRDGRQKSHKTGEMEGEDEIADVLGLKYQHKLTHNPNVWTNKSILEWFDNGYRVDLLPLFENIRTQLEEYMELQQDAQYDVAAVYILGTYCFELFETYPLLLLNGLRESGKSKLKKLIRLMSFHGREASNISESALFRSITESKPCLCFDEYEDMDTDRKRYCDQLLNAGIEKGSTVLRSDSNPTGWVSREYDVYCPKVIANISGLNDVTASRAIPLGMMKTVSEKGKLRPKTTDPMWQEARDDCHVGIMCHWQEIRAAYEAFNEPSLANRQEDIWRPLLAVASCVEKEVYDRLLIYAEDSGQENAVECFDSDWDFQLLDVLAEHVEEERWVSVKDIKYWLDERLKVEKPPREKWIGRRLKVYHQFKRRRAARQTEYLLSLTLIENRIKRRYGVISVNSGVSGVSAEMGGVV